MLILSVGFFPGLAQNRTIDSLRTLLDNSDTDRVEILIELAIQNNIAGNYEVGLAFANEAVPLALDGGDSLEIVMAYRFKGAGLRRMEKLDEALEWLIKASGIAERNSYITEMKYLLNLKGLIYMSKAQYDFALDCSYQSLVIREEQGDQSEISIAMNNIGVIYFKLDNYSRALEYFNKSLGIRRKIKDDYELDRLLINIGLSEVYLGNFEMATSHIKDAFVVCGNNCSDEIKTEGEHGLGVIDYNAHKWKESRKHYAISYEMAKKSHNLRYQAENLISLGRLARESGDLQEAEKSLKNAEAIAVKAGYNQLLIDGYRELFKLYSLKGEDKKEILYLKKYVYLNDSLISLDLVKNISTIQSRFDERENLKNIKTLEENIVLKNEAIARQQLLNIVLGSAAVLLVIIGILIYRLYALRNKSNKQLDDKVRQRTLQLEEGQAHLQGVLQEQHLFIENIREEMKALTATLKGLSLLEKQGVETEFKFIAEAMAVNILDVIINRIDREINLRKS